MSVTTETTPIKFYFYSLKFTPYNDSVTADTTTSILKDVFNYLFKEQRENRGHLIDRYQNSTTEPPRELFMSNAVLMLKERRIRCSLALLRSGRKPMVKLANKFAVIPLSESLGSITELTHFYIDYTHPYAVICEEFNSHGPRITDFEFYLRNISKNILRKAKATDVTVYMNSAIDKALSEFKNVLNFEIKLQPQKINQMDNDMKGYFTGLSNFGTLVKPKFIKLEAFFQSQGKVESKELYNDANTMVKFLLNKFSTKPLNIDCFESFEVKYEDKNGNEEFFNLLKGKKEIVINVDLNINRTHRQMYELIVDEFDLFVKSL